MAETILIVDDDLETLRLVGLMLQRQGYNILAAADGTQALSLATAELPDLIILDVMMPDVDGITVTRKLRAVPETSQIPIIMFTAKGQVDDKVAGYEAGVDDYLTKPTHPAELVAHIKAILARSIKSRTGLKTGQLGYVLGFLGVRGGVGVSTLCLNAAIALKQQTKSDVILTEMRPGQGHINMELGLPNNRALCNLLERKISEITSTAVDNELIATQNGIRILTSSVHPKDIKFIYEAEKTAVVLEQLRRLAKYIITDIGVNLFPEPEKLISRCNEIMLVIDPHPNSVLKAKEYISYLNDLEFGRAKPFTVVLVNRQRSDVQLTLSQVQDSLGISISQFITPMPELAYQASVRMTPVILLQPEGLASQQFNKIAESIMQRTS